MLVYTVTTQQFPFRSRLMMVAKYFLAFVIIVIHQDCTYTHGKIFMMHDHFSNNVSGTNRNTNSGNTGTPRIVGGTIAPAGTYPWFTAIIDQFGQWKGCGGMLIAPSYVLTAAHCFQNDNASTTFVLVGAYCLTIGNCGEPSERIAVSRLISHPDYSDQTFDNDFALLQLDSPVQSISPVMM